MLVSHICQGRTKLGLGTEAGDGLNFYQRRVDKDERIETIKKLAKLPVQKPVIYQSKCFPAVEIRSASGLQDTRRLELANTLLTDSPFHREALDRLGLLKPRSLYDETPFISEQGQPNLKLLGVEYLSMLRQGLNLKVEYEGSDELKRFREGYLLHILDYVLQDRERVHFNNTRIFEEEHKDRVTLDNVFELAKVKQEVSDEEGNSDIDTPEEDEKP